MTANRISQLALAAKYKSGYKEGLLFAGWSAGGIPLLTTSIDNLAPRAQKTIDVIEASGIQMQTLKISGLAAFDFNFVGPIFDFSDTSTISLKEDVLDIGLVDSSGSQVVLKFGELQLLSAISKGVIEWQYISDVAISALVVKAVKSYSLIIQGKSSKNDRDTLIIFKPVLSENGNSIEFSSFVREIVGRLIALDEQQQPEYKKGYLEASSGNPNKSSIWDLLVAPTAEGKRFRPGRSLLKLAGQLGLVDTRGLPLDEKENLLKEGLNNASLSTLVEIATAMYECADLKIK